MSKSLRMKQPIRADVWAAPDEVLIGVSDKRPLWPTCEAANEWQGGKPWFRPAYLQVLNTFQLPQV